MNTPSKAIVLLSGGLDSATVLAIARKEGYECAAISFAYGQRHEIELTAAKQIASDFGVKDHRVVNLDLRQFGHSALTDDIDVPKGRALDAPEENIPITYVPARNIIFLSYALAFAEVTESCHIFIGVNALDYSGYPDCRPSFIRSFQEMANVGTKAGVEGSPFQIHTPLISLTKAEIIRRGIELNVNYAHTLSCYDPDFSGKHCGQCDSCQLRKKGFREANIPDPTDYADD